MEQEIVILYEHDDTLVIEVSKSLPLGEGGIVVAVCICCGGPAHVAYDH